MALECSVCSSEIKKGVMEKPRGTYIKSGKKMYLVCSKCQKVGEENLKDKIGKKL